MANDVFIEGMLIKDMFGLNDDQMAELKKINNFSESIRWLIEHGFVIKKIENHLRLVAIGYDEYKFVYIDVDKERAMEMFEKETGYKPINVKELFVSEQFRQHQLNGPGTLHLDDSGKPVTEGDQ